MAKKRYADGGQVDDELMTHNEPMAYMMTKTPKLKVSPDEVVRRMADKRTSAEIIRDARAKRPAPLQPMPDIPDDRTPDQVMEDRSMGKAYDQSGKKRGGAVKMAKGGFVKAADGIATRGKTRGRYI